MKTKKILINVALIVAGLNLAGCSSYMSFEGMSVTKKPVPTGRLTSMNEQGQTTEVPVPEASATGGASVGGPLGKAMDEVDRTKLYRALDKAPGKSTEWVNANTGVSYTVTPIKKITINGNPYCRAYQIISKRGAQQHQSNGTACVSASGSWEAS